MTSANTNVLARGDSQPRAAWPRLVRGVGDIPGGVAGAGSRGGAEKRINVVPLSGTRPALSSHLRVALARCMPCWVVLNFPSATTTCKPACSPLARED